MSGVMARERPPKFWTVSKFFMKLFNTNNMEIIKACQSYFSFKLLSVLIPIRVNKFTARTGRFEIF